MLSLWNSAPARHRLNAAYEAGSADGQPNALEMFGKTLEIVSRTPQPTMHQALKLTWNLGVVSGNFKIASTHVN